jgi:hypothetical protein
MVCSKAKTPEEEPGSKAAPTVKIPLVVNCCVMPLEMSADATKEEGKLTIACGAGKEKPRKHKVLLLGDSPSERLCRTIKTEFK